VVTAGLVFACTPWPRTSIAPAPSVAKEVAPTTEHPVRIPEIYERRGGDIALAPDADQAVAQRYRSSPHGEVHGALRMTILAARQSYHVGEAVRVLHAVEAVDPSAEAWVMGPKPVFGEYDGAVVRGPAIDFNFDITSYTFDRPGRHTIEWRLGEVRSNTIVIDVR